VILDGKIIPADRCKEPAVSVKGEVIDLWYSGKAHAHRGNIQAVLAPDGFPLWVSEAEPGSVHDLTAAHALPALYLAAATCGVPKVYCACELRRYAMVSPEAEVPHDPRSARRGRVRRPRPCRPRSGGKGASAQG
jgi:hypothetical protein